MLDVDDCAYECPFTREGHESGSVNVDHEFVVADPGRVLDLEAPETPERLRLAGWEPDFNVCGGCHHAGGDHDLNNRCLICGDHFASMTEDEKWAWGVAALKGAPK